MKGKLAISILVVFIFGVVLLLINAGRTEVNQVYIPSELLTASTNGSLEPKALKMLRLAGRVADNQISYQVEPEIKLEFWVKDPKKKDGTEPLDTTKTLKIIYNGIKPDMFAVERDVIVDGEFRSGIFYATKLLTQCPSKYEQAKPQ